MLNINFYKKAIFKVSRLAALFMFLLMCFGSAKYICFAASETATVTLPQKITGLEKLEYTINGAPMGSVAGKSQIKATCGSKINFLLKFESEGYDNLNAKSVKINSAQGACLSLNHYNYDQNGKIVMFAPTDNEKIDSEQTYVSSDYMVKADDSLSISGIELNKYEIKISSDSDAKLSEAVSVVCTDDKNNILESVYDDDSKSFNITNVSFKSNLKLSINPTEAYSQSEINLTSANSAISYTQNGYAIYNVRSDITAQITGIAKNQYTLNFKNYSNATFKTADETAQTLAENKVVFYGDTFKFKCETQEEILKNSEITVNDVAIRGINGIYTLKNITENANILITPKENAKYSVSLMNGENRVSLTDANGNKISTGYAKLGTNFNFRLTPSQAYSRYILSSLTYAVPTSKLQEKSFDALNPGNEFLITPSGAGVYSVNNITEPITIIVNNLKVNSYTVHTPQNMLGANLKANVTDGITKISECEYSVEHGKNLDLTLEAKDGYDISDSTLSTDSLAQVQKIGNEYKITNITGDTYVSVSNIKPKTYSVSFDSNGIDCTSLQGNVFVDNVAQIEHQSGILKFSVSAAENCTVAPEGIKLSVSGGAVLKNEKTYYELTNVTSDTIIHVSGVSCPQVNVNLSTPNDDLEITSPNGKVISGQDQKVDYGEDFSFTIKSKTGQNVENITFNNIEDNKITVAKNNLSSVTYNLLGASSNVSLLAQTPSPSYGISNIKMTQNFILQRHNLSATEKFGDAIKITGGELNLQNLANEEYSKRLFSIIDGENNPAPKIFNAYDAGDNHSIKFFSNPELTEEITGIYKQVDNGISLEFSPNVKLEGTHDDGKVSLESMHIVNGSPSSLPASAFEIMENGVGYVLKNLYCILYRRDCWQDWEENDPTSGIKTKYTHIITPQEDHVGCTVSKNGTPTASSNGAYNFRTDENVMEVTVKLECEAGYEFNENTRLKFSDNGTYYATITRQSLESNSTVLVCTLKISPFATDDQIYLEYTTNTPCKKKKLTATFLTGISNSLFYKNDANETSEITFEYGDSLDFYTNPKNGYDKTSTETLTIKIGEKNYTLNPDENEPVPQGVTRTINDNSREVTYGIGEITIVATKDSSDSSKINYNISGLKENVSLSTTRKLKKLNVSFTYTEGINFDSGATINNNLNYGDDFVFTLTAQSGYDISNCEVWANIAGVNSLISMTNTKYVIYNITEDVLITVKNVTKQNLTISFGIYDGVTFQDELGNTLSQTMSVPYGEEFKFKIAFDEKYSQYANDASKFSVKAISEQSSSELRPTDNLLDNLYSIEGITADVTIKLEGLYDNTYNINFTEETGIKFYDVSNTTEPTSNASVTHGENFSFVIQTSGERYNIDNIEVSAVSADKPQSPVRILPSNGVYTIENITSDYTINVTGVSVVSRKVELRTISGAAFVDESGNAMSNTLTVPDGDKLSFYVSLGIAYNKSTAEVAVKGSEAKLTPDNEGKYTKEITADTIIEITGITKNTYNATFVYCEGVEYRTSRNKAFDFENQNTKTQEIEYGENFYFRISLLDAYDQSYPHVLLNGDKTLVENGGVYCIQEITDDVTVTVENVEKNPEEVAMENIKDIPEVVNTASDVNAIIKATQIYNSLSDENKEKVTNTKELERAQTQAAKHLHTSGGITVSNVDWYIKIVATDLYHDAEQLKVFSEEVERRAVLSLYKIELVNTLTGEEYTIPYGKTATFTMKAPDLTGYQNAVIAHLNSSDNMEYLDFNVINGEATFTTSSTNLFGVAAKGIPNYAENPSLLQISVAPLVRDEEELQSLLGEGLVSQLGNLIDDEDDDNFVDTTPQENTNASNSAGHKNNSSSNDTSERSGSDSTFLSAIKELGENVTEITEKSVNKTFDWAKNNEFWSVIIVLAVGSGLIAWIITSDRKKKRND